MIVEGQVGLACCLPCRPGRDSACRNPRACTWSRPAGHGRGWRAELLHVAHQVAIAKDLPQVVVADSQRQARAVPVHLGRDGRVDGVLGPQFLSQPLDARVVVQVGAHEHVGDDRLHPALTEGADSGNRALQRAGQHAGAGGSQAQSPQGAEHLRRQLTSQRLEFVLLAFPARP